MVKLPGLYLVTGSYGTKCQRLQAVFVLELHRPRLIGNCIIIIIIIIIITITILSCHRPFLPGNSLEPTVIPTAQASSFTLQYFPYYVWCSKYSCLVVNLSNVFLEQLPNFSLTLKNRASYICVCVYIYIYIYIYIYDGRTATLQMLHFIYSFQQI